jgi:hypothetical protein
MSTKDTLVKAKEILATTGISRNGYYVDRNGCLCALGAIFVACGVTVRDDPADEHNPKYLNYTGYNGEEYDEAYIALHKALMQIAPDVTSIATFNDMLASDEQIFNLFDKAIEVAE